MNLDGVIPMLRRRWPSLRSKAEDEPVFLMAAGWRSGSTMLQRMLMRHCLVWGEPFGSSAMIGRMAEPLQRFGPDWPPDDFFVSSPHWGEQLGEKWTANLYPPMQHFLDAHVEFYRRLLAEPSRQRGFSRWGVKEVRYGFEYAVYLQWLFPKARFLFLIRSPYECFASYRRLGARVMRFWPENSITTPEQFGNHWLYVASGFCNRFQEVGGLLLGYEKLIAPDFDAKLMEDYLGFPIDHTALRLKVGASPAGSVFVEEMARLEAVVNPLASSLGYVNPYSQQNSKNYEQPVPEPTQKLEL